MSEPARKVGSNPPTNQTAPVLQEYVEKRPWYKGGDKHSLATNWDELHKRFPDMAPIKRPPTMHTVNLCGLMLHGARDRDAETGTYVKTRAVVVLLLPLCFLEAYRVKDAGRGWFFLGRVPLSPKTRQFNWIVPPALFLLITAWVTAGVIVPRLAQAESSGKLLAYGLIGLLGLTGAGIYAGLRKLANFGMFRDPHTIGNMPKPIH
jgi:hypothetical protein